MTYLILIGDGLHNFIEGVSIAGIFLYIGASDLVLEVNKTSTLASGILHFVAFTSGLLLLFAIAIIGEH